MKGMKIEELTPEDRLAVAAFQNFLSWGERPGGEVAPTHRVGRHVPPAWWAYALDASRWCPPKGEW